MADAIVAGHLCLDVIPELQHGAVFAPGKLVEAGAARLSTGGAVSNVGQALRTLGIETKLVGTVGDDLFGSAVLELLGLAAEGVIVREGEVTSYTIVINLRDHDRMFLHAPGLNATFDSSVVLDSDLAAAKLMHFGYPPLMEKMFLNDGEELMRLFQRAKRAGVTTSLDMSLPDPNSASGKVDWRPILRRVLPFVDLFCPSLDEFQFMMRTDESADVLAIEALRMGAKVVAIKRGDEGLSLRSAPRLVDVGRAFTDNCRMIDWHDINLHQPCYPVDVVGTTGSGDATIAGLLMGVLRGMSPTETAKAACAVGACSCEAADAVSGIKDWRETQMQFRLGWEQIR